MRLHLMRRLRSGLHRLSYDSITLVCLLASIATAPAAVTTVGFWRLGENNPGAAPGVTATNAVDIAGTHTLIFHGNARYSGDVSTGASNFVGSSLSVNFTNGAFATNTIVSTNLDNFGIECWVKPTATNGGGIIAYNGGTGGPGFGGWGLITASDNTYQALYGGVTLFGTNAVVTNVWTHLALVRASGTATLYVNGNATVTSTSIPAHIGGNFALGAPPQSPTSQFFTGVMDEVRVFTFNPGEFSVGDLLVNGPPLKPGATTSFGSIQPDGASAVLWGAAYPNGLPATAWFQWGTTTNYGQTTAPTNLTATAAGVNVSTLIGGLIAGTTYHLQLVVSNVFGTNAGGDQYFTAPLFVNVNNSLPAIDNGSVAWGDYNNDGFLDILIAGSSQSQVWQNNGFGGIFAQDFLAVLPPLQTGSVAWGDYDNDGSLDILIAGDYGTNFTQIWHNEANGHFTLANAVLPGISQGAIAWGDYDNDGRLDILIAGNSSAGLIAQVWHNLGNGIFTNLNAGLTGIVQCSVAWGDYDNDGRLDILISGLSNGGLVTQIWHNNGNGTFTKISAGLPGLSQSHVAWGDYDNDGLPDILLAGNNGTTNICQVWHNNGNGTFTNINAGLPGISQGSLAWGDYDNDGRLDILLSGLAGAPVAPITQVWHNNGNGTFSNVNAGLPGLYDCSVAWGDYDNDGRLDILLAGPGSGGPAQVWRNLTPIANTPPTFPTGPTANLNPSTSLLTFSWNASTDLETASSNLTYNVRIGNTPGGSQIFSPMSLYPPLFGINGKRLLPQSGNVLNKLSLSIPAVSGTYYWSVQAVDGAFAGSIFLPEQSFKVLPVKVLVTATNITPGDINGDGFVDQSELAAVLTAVGTNRISASNVNQVLVNYLTGDPAYMTDVAGLGSSNVTFNLSNSPAANFTVQTSTNLSGWQILGPASLNYHFTDTNSPLGSNRFYRLVYP